MLPMSSPPPPPPPPRESFIMDLCSDAIVRISHNNEIARFYIKLEGTQRLHTSAIGLLLLEGAFYRDASHPVHQVGSQDPQHMNKMLDCTRSHLFNVHCFLLIQLVFEY